jgi:hypothetical protein
MRSGKLGLRDEICTKPHYFVKMNGAVAAVCLIGGAGLLHNTPAHAATGTSVVQASNNAGVDTQEAGDVTDVAGAVDTFDGSYFHNTPPTKYKKRRLTCQRLFLSIYRISSLLCKLLRIQ